MARQLEYSCAVTNCVRPNNTNILLSFSCPQIASIAMPGQFVNLSGNQFLRRPIGIMDVDRIKGEFSVGIKINGEGTSFFASLQPGDIISVIGPLGHGFELDKFDRVITVGGGTGVFPLFFVQKYCLEHNIEGIAVCGYRSLEESILTEEFNQVSCAVSFASDAGDMMVSGNAGAALIQVLNKLKNSNLNNTLIVTCGPKAMMQYITSIASENNIDCQVSLEERMACGIGICLVCVCKIKSNTDNEWDHKRCCIEGPVFNAREVIW